MGKRLVSMCLIKCLNIFNVWKTTTLPQCKVHLIVQCPMLFVFIQCHEIIPDKMQPCTQFHISPSFILSSCSVLCLSFHLWYTPAHPRSKVGYFSNHSFTGKERKDSENIYSVYMYILLSTVQLFSDIIARPHPQLTSPDAIFYL